MTPNRKDATCAASAPEICKCGHPDYAHGDIDEGVFCGGDEFEECECKGFEHEGKDTLPLPLASPAPIGEGTHAEQKCICGHSIYAHAREQDDCYGSETCLCECFTAAPKEGKP